MSDVILTTKRFEMKFPLAYICAEDIVEAIGDEETIQYMDSVANTTYTKEDATSFMGFLDYIKDKESCLELGVFDKDTKQFLGMCTLEAIDKENGSCELGYWLSKAYVGKGCMMECATRLLQYAKDEMGMKRVDAFVICEHKKSIALLTRLGFRETAKIEKDCENKGILVDRFKFEKYL